VHRRHVVIAVATVALLVVVFALPKLTSEAPHPAASATSYGFAGPYGVAFSGGDTFVSNQTGNSVIEFNTIADALVRVLHAKSYRFDTPQAMAVSGADGFVANLQGNTVTEFNTTTGALVRVIGGESYGFSGPRALAISGVDALVSNGNYITEFNTTTGALVRVLDAQPSECTRSCKSTFRDSRSLVTTPSRPTNPTTRSSSSTPPPGHWCE
jgi:hypothetical protein